MALKERVAALTAWVMGLKPVRVFLQYGAKGGALLAAGLSFRALFAIFAAIWVGFAVAGFVIRANPVFEDAFLRLLSTNLPGLFDTDRSSGALDPEELFGTSILGWTGAIAAASLIATSLGFLASGRDAVRVIFELPPDRTNFLLLKLKDLGLAVAFGLALLLSAALSVVSNAALDWILMLLGVSTQSTAASLATRAVVLLVVVLLDVVILGLFYRVVSGIRIPWRQLAQGVLLAGLALGVLQALGSTLLGGATRNPLLASFAVIIGLLIWFNLICQVILFGASWIAVTAEDEDVDLKGVRRSGKPATGTPSDVGTAL